MAVNATTEWRIRAGGAQTNGGGYDPGIAGAATDYTDQDSPQANDTDLACTTGGVTITSASAKFTAAMIGNAVRISGGTNFTAGYYFIVTFNSTTSVDVDRDPTTGSNGSGGTWAVGGAFGHLWHLSSGGTATAPSVPPPLAAGHTIHMRGSGSDDPGSADYTQTYGSAIYHSYPNGTHADRIKLIGYNGRPRYDIDSMLLFNNNYWTVDNIHVKRSGTYFLNQGLLDSNQTAFDVYNCILDQNGNDCILVNRGRHIIGNCFRNTGGGSGTTYAAVISGHYGGVISGNFFQDLLGKCGLTINHMASAYRNIFDSLSGDGIQGSITINFHCSIISNVFYNCGGDGVDMSAGANYATDVTILNNIFSENGGYGLRMGGTAASNDAVAFRRFDYNAYYSNTSGAKLNITAGTNDVTLTGSPFVDASADDFTLNAVSGGGAKLKEKGWLPTLGQLSPISYLDIGAYQTQASAGVATSALVDVPGGVQVPPEVWARVEAVSPSFANITLNAVNEHCYAILRVPKAGNILRVGFRLNSVSSFVGTIEARIEGVDLTNGEPDGTLHEADANASFTPATGWQWVTLTDSCTVAAGDLIAAGIDITSYTSGSVSVSHNLTDVLNETMQDYPYSIGPTTTKREGTVPIALEYDDGSKLAMPGLVAIDAIANENWSSSSNPDRRGVRFTPRFKCRIAGFRLDGDADQNFTWQFYDSDGTTVLQSRAEDSDVRSGAAQGHGFYHFDTPQELTVGDNYRLVILPGTTNARDWFVVATLDAVGDQDAWSLGQDFLYTTVHGAPTDISDWTTTDTKRVIGISLLLDQLDTGAGVQGGGGSMGIPQGLHPIGAGITA